MNTTENNKIIAKFMGGIVVNNSKMYFDVSLFKNTVYTKNIPFEELLYNEDWNWLMEVVEKIESLKISVLIGLDNCVIEQYYGKTSLSLGLVKKETKIEAVYDACVEFIKWYNEQEVK